MNKEQPLIIVTGANGQLGHEFRVLEKDFPEMRFMFVAKLDLDIAVESWVMEFITRHKPAGVVNCAAYTNVETAEDDPESAALANTYAPGFLASACRSNNALLVHFSTDYVFDGEKKESYVETDAVNPLNVYGNTKLEGERIVDAKMERHLTIRTSWLYSTFGHNFFRTMLRLGHENGDLKVVDDQLASPTYARDLAADVLMVLKKIVVNEEPFEYGLYHYAQHGEASWYDFAKKIMSESGTNAKVNAVKSDAFPTKAKRPSYSKLDVTKWTQNIGPIMHNWEEGVNACIADMHNS